MQSSQVSTTAVFICDEIRPICRLLQDKCREYAVITEPMNGLRLVVCGLNGYQRHQHVYTSRSNVVRLQMAAWPSHSPLTTSASGSDVTSARYIIHYQGEIE